MNSFRYQAVELDGRSVQGVVEAEDRKAALQQLGQRGLYPSNLELAANGEAAKPGTKANDTASSPRIEFRFGKRVGRKDVTAFTREMSALLAAAIPIPQALTGLGEEESNPALRDVVLGISDSVRKGASLSAALEEQPRLFSNLYVSMVRVGEEAGQLPKVMSDLANLLEHEDEVRGEVITAVAYPCFVLTFGLATVVFLLTFVMPKLTNMLQETLPVLPLPTLILLNISHFFHYNWYWVLIAVVAGVFGLARFLRTPRGAEILDHIKLRVPILGSVFRAAALNRFARTLGTLARSGVSLLPALKIVENTIGNRVLAAQVARVAEETRGGDSLAKPLRKLNIFPRTVVQMIDVGEESGRLDEMLLKVADIEERHMRARTKTLISLLAPVLILVVGAMVGFIVIALLLPILKMSSGLH
jgi:type II secretory pathway component PulF